MFVNDTVKQSNYKLQQDITVLSQLGIEASQILIYMHNNDMFPSISH